MKCFVIVGAVLLLAMVVISPAYASFTDSILTQVSGEFKKVYYNEQNVTSVLFDPNSASVIFETGNNATLEVKVPKVYKTGPNHFILKNGEEIAPEIKAEDDCFYYMTIETSTPETIEIAFTYWPEYHETVEDCETFGPVAPLKQTTLGIPISEIKCKDNLVLIQKHDDSPACVKEQTKQKLIEREWTRNIALTQSLFQDIKSNILGLGYSICDIQLSDDKITIDLHKFFKDSEPEKKIISQIPPVEYEIVYHEGYSDYFINTITSHECGGLENED